MKRNLFIFILVLLSNFVGAQVSKTINEVTAGTLTTLLTATEKTTVTNLTLTGTIDARDVKCIRDEMTVLASLDLGESTIVDYNGTSGTTNNTSTYPANEMPTNSFLNLTLSKALTTLKTIILPKTLTSIGQMAFDYCTGLTSVVFGNSITSIGSQAFCYCSGLTTLTIPNSVTSIGDYTFNCCSGLTGNLTIPNSVTSIGTFAFNKCNQLASITIGNGVTALPELSLGQCTGLKSIKCMSTIPPIADFNSFSSVYSSTLVYVPIGTTAAYKWLNRKSCVFD